MKYYIEYSEEGCVLHCGGMPDLEFLPEGNFVEVPELVDPGTCIYVGGQLIDLGPSPSMFHKRSPTAQSWQLSDDFPLSLIQDVKWKEIKAKRSGLELAGFAYMGKMIDSDTKSVQRITGAAQVAQAAMLTGDPFVIEWTCQDNTILSLTAQEMVGMTVAMAQHVNNLHVTSRDLREQVYGEGATRESVLAIVWPAP